MINVIINGTTITITIPMKKDSQLPAAIDRNPGTPPTPTDVATTCCIVINAPAKEVPITAAIKGYLYLRFTPNKAGSVTPSHAEIPDVPAKPFVFSSFAVIITANTADP